MLDQLSILTGDSEATFVYQMIALLADVRLGSPGFSGDVECPEDCQRSLSMEWLTETLVEGCLAKCNTLDDAIALKQSLAASKKAGMSVASAEKLDREIEQKETALIEKLVQAEAAMVLDVCGLGNLVDAWNRWKNQNQPPTMASYPGLSPSEVEAGVRDFFASLYSPPLPSLEGTIKDVAARKAVRSKIAETVCTTYAGMYQSMTSSPQVGGYADTGFLIHRPDEVATLFSV
jgi:conserved oligomeric Golgi complex subunit 6